MKCRATAFGLSFVILAAGLAHASVDYTVIEREASISRGKQIRSIESIANNGAAVGTILVSVTAVRLATSLAYGPVVATPDSGSVRSKSYNPPDLARYRLSPIPPGADWTS